MFPPVTLPHRSAGHSQDRTHRRDIMMVNAKMLLGENGFAPVGTGLTHPAMRKVSAPPAWAATSQARHAIGYRPIGYRPIGYWPIGYWK